MAVSNEKNTININATIYENIQNPVLNDTTNYTVLMGSKISLNSYDVDTSVVNKYTENTNYKNTFIQNINFHTNL